jgi:RNA polymerase sigma-70 factor (ECF subfamily)
MDYTEQHMPTLTPPCLAEDIFFSSLKTSSEEARTNTARRVSGYLEDPDVQLMLRVQSGCARSFAELQQRYTPRIFGYFCRLLRDRAEAEDLTQDVFLRLYRSRIRYQPRARFATWIFHITQNVARNALRSRRRHPCVHLDPEEPASRHLMEDLLIDRATTPSHPVERDELAGVVRAAVAELAGRQRTALELHQFHDRTYAEVAAELEMTPKAAKSLLYRARNQLRETLQPFMS